LAGVVLPVEPKKSRNERAHQSPSPHVKLEGEFTRLLTKLATLAFLCISGLLAQPAPQSAPQSSKGPDAPMSHFDPKAMDRNANPCVDFYQYACGGWLKANPIPADQARWGRFSEVDERNKLVLREILEEASKPAPNRDSTTQKIGDYYAACMDEKAIDAR